MRNNMDADVRKAGSEYAKMGMRRNDGTKESASGVAFQFGWAVLDLVKLAALEELSLFEGNTLNHIVMIGCGGVDPFPAVE